jgi:dTDP-4-amino-4,6-dideoxygalactose transaminase
MAVPFLDLKAQYSSVAGEHREALLRVYDSGRYLLGNELEEFESSYAKWCGRKYCVGVGSGLDALWLTLKAWEIGKDDEVIVPGHTFIATWLAVTMTGAKPAPIEPEEKSCVIDADRIESAINSHTKAIIPVHLYGRLADMEAINVIARQYGLKVLEDAAQAHGAERNGIKSGAFGDAGAFSFYPAKNLAALSDGGAVVTNDIELYQKLISLRNYGSKNKYVHELMGINSRLDEFQAALLSINLKNIDSWNKERRQLALHYNELLSPLTDYGLNLPMHGKGKEMVWHQYVIRFKQRDSLMKYLKNQDIETIIHYPIPPHMQIPYAQKDPFSLPITESICASCLSLPLYPGLKEENQAEVANAIKAFLLL